MNQNLPTNEVVRKDHLPEGLGDELIRLITENTREIFWVADPQTMQLLYISPSYEEIMGRSCASLYQDIKSWLDAVHPDDRERIRAHMDR